MLVHQSGWNTKQYFDQIYDDRTPFPLIFFMKGKEALIFLPITKEKNLAKEMFRKFWKDNTALIKRKEVFDKLAAQIDNMLLTELSYAK